ncbi:MAG: hypothetical protein GY765_20465 [bacterium]|nr:hypothetical protein [bacterium]
MKHASARSKKAKHGKKNTTAPAGGEGTQTAAQDADGNGDASNSGRKKSKAYANVMLRFTSSLVNAGKPQYRAKLDVFGYTLERIAEATALMEETKGHELTKSKNKAALSSNIKNFEPLRKEVQYSAAYILTLTKAAVMKDPANKLRLGLTKPREKYFPHWMNQWRKFFAILLDTPAVTDRLAAMGVSREQLLQEQKKVHDLSDLYAERKSLKADAQKATALKNASFNKLKTWMSDFFQVCKMAFRDDPVMLKGLGIEY